MTDIVRIQKSEYDAILRQAVAVIDKTRAMVATTVCSAIGTAHWEIGSLLHDKKIESKQKGHHCEKTPIIARLFT